VTEITASMVKELRDATSAGMMECKRALQETDGDFDAAMRLLRERGMASAAKRAGRETTEGAILTQTDEDTGTIVAIGCETEPVSKNEDFHAFAQDVLRTVHAHGETAVASLEERRAELSGKLGENIQIVGASRHRAGHGEAFATYVHMGGGANKVGVLLKYRGGDPGLARQLALHISFARPTYKSRDEVPADLVATERDILSSSDEVQSKPAEVREKIVDGMMNKRFFGESVLGEQTWIHDTNLTVAKALEQGRLELVDWVWYSLG
jgi:elongation factor Ts